MRSKSRRSGVLGLLTGSLRFKIIAWAFVPTALILLAVALVNLHSYQQVTEELVIERDQDLTRLSAAQLKAELTEYTDLLNTTARSAALYRGDPAAQRDVLRRASNRLVIFDGGVLLLDTFGRVVASEPERPAVWEQDWSNRSYYRQVLRTQMIGSTAPVFSDIIPDGPDGVDVVVLAVAVKSEEGEFLGVLVGMFRVGANSVSSLYAEVVKMRLGGSGSIYLLDGNGRVIYHSDTALIGEDFSAQAVAQQVMSGETGAIRTRDFEGQDIVAAFSPVPDTPWGLATEESWAKLTAGSQGYQQGLVLLLVLGVVVPALVVAIGVRQMTRPITELISAAQSVARGNFGRTISAQTADEIGALADQFNMMSTQLAETYANLEQRLADRTKVIAALTAIGTVVSGSSTLDEVLSDALDETLEVTGLHAGGIYLLQPEAGVLNIAAHKGLSPDFVVEMDRLMVGQGLYRQVVQAGEPVVVKDLAADMLLTRGAVKKLDYHSMTVVPLVSRGKVLGSFFVLTRDYHEFTAQDTELLVSIGRQLGVTVENAQLFTQVEERMQELEALYRADEDLYRHLELDQVLQTLVDVAVNILHAHKSSLLVWDDEQERLVVKAARGFSPETLAQMSFGLGEGTVGQVVRSGEPIIVEDVEVDSRVATWVTAPEGIRSFMHFPIKIEGRVFGVFNVDYEEPRAFGAQEQRLFTALAQRAALAIENVQLYGQAKHAAVLEERQRLARELHDAVTQTLFSASLIGEVLPRLWELDPAEGRQRLRELNELTRGALAEMRALLLELRPAALEEAEVSDLLRQLADSFTGRARVPVTLQVESECALPPQVKVVLYRIAQEALNNVAKHANASQVIVSLRCGSEGVKLQISDDGRGFDASNVPPEHLGLGIMRERAASIDAGLKIESQAGCGTEVEVVWQTGIKPT